MLQPCITILVGCYISTFLAVDNGNKKMRGNLDHTQWATNTVAALKDDSDRWSMANSFFGDGDDRNDDDEDKRRSAMMVTILAMAVMMMVMVILHSWWWWLHRKKYIVISHSHPLPKSSQYNRLATRVALVPNWSLLFVQPHVAAQGFHLQSPSWLKKSPSPKKSSKLGLRSLV